MTYVIFAITQFQENYPCHSEPIQTGPAKCADWISTLCSECSRETRPHCALVQFACGQLITPTFWSLFITTRTPNISKSMSTRSRIGPTCTWA
ncbi:hypothetical protein RSal33209_3352 [Renibacterium salmoninarum ATCC 33209]|uniref:Uncharacterized protein n=1 Tax=Renibacterium salmoninarum (strain ATCC 33209 / DSM 20767 / JCM 11484 / NBRC 15589 / NCIMB 2235) TaxID=288705 RepID=A9WV41_RENSM|nr:hypothetical protein RSal33209_3352 [Renibacterium salmoninarum ATCC 33209]